MLKIIAVIGTLDTKGTEIRYLDNKIKEYGLNKQINTVVIDSGILGQPNGIVPDIPREQVAQAAGLSIKEIREAKSRGESIHLMAEGLKRLLHGLYKEKKLHGVVSLTGVTGGELVTPAFESLPIGIPKMIATPLASGIRPFSLFIHSKDVIVMHTVVDIVGINPISRIVFDNIAGAIVGACLTSKETTKAQNLVAMTLQGNTTKGGMYVKSKIEEHGYKTVVFHSNGVGGRSMEELAREGWFCGVIDYTTNEIYEDIVGGLQKGVGPERLSVVGKLGIPQVVVTGSIDFFDQGPIKGIPRKWQDRKLYSHSPSITLVRLTKEEMSYLGRVFAERLNLSKGPVKIAIPLGGSSIPNRVGGLFWDEEADRAFVNRLRENLRQDIDIVEIDAHINDEQFAGEVTQLFLEVIQEA